VPASSRPPLRSREPTRALLALCDGALAQAGLGSELRERGFEVAESDVASFEAKIHGLRPRVLVVDLGVEGAMDLAWRLLEGAAADPPEVFFVGGDDHRASLRETGAAGRVFRRSTRYERLLDAIVRAVPAAVPSEAPPLGTSDDRAARDPERSSNRPRGTAEPSLSSLPFAPIDLPAFHDPEFEGLLETSEASFGNGELSLGAQLSPGLVERLSKAESRVAEELSRYVPNPPPTSSGTDYVSGNVLSLLDEPIDEGDEGSLVSPDAASAIVRPKTATGTAIFGDPGRSSTRSVDARAPEIDASLEPLGAVTPTREPPASRAALPPPPPSHPSVPIASELAASVAPPPPSHGELDANTDLAARLDAMLQHRGASTLQASALLPLLEAAEARVEAAARRDSSATSEAALLAAVPSPDVRERPTAPPSAPVRFQEPRAVASGRAGLDRRSLPPPPPPPLPTPLPSAREAGALGPPIHAARVRPPLAVTAATSMVSRAQPAASFGSGSMPAVAPPRAANPRETVQAIPMVFGPGEGLRPVARAIAFRMSGCLTFSTGAGARRVVLQDGDIVTASSEAARESLVAFLASRGDLDRDAEVRLASRLAPSGRHAGAALVAQGYLTQGDLWPVLRAHAEWLVGEVLRDGPGTVELVDDPPGRLKSEPRAFGGSAGAEIFVEAARRVLDREASIAALGGPYARLAHGPRFTLLAECAVSAEEESAVRSCPGRTIAECAPDPSSTLPSVLRALAELEVVTAHASIERAAAPKREEPDPLDDEATRQRVRARIALVREGDYFELLGVPRGATSYEIKRAYLDQRRAFEPARLLPASCADLFDDVRLILEVLDEAYDILRDAPRRERYRRAIEAGPPDA
jgi:hypothetical protein